MMLLLYSNFYLGDLCQNLGGELIPRKRDGVVHMTHCTRVVRFRNLGVGEEEPILTFGTQQVESCDGPIDVQ